MASNKVRRVYMANSATNWTCPGQVYEVTVRTYQYTYPLGCGADNAAALGSGGELFGWGRNQSGQLLTPVATAAGRSSPLLISTSYRFKDISYGNGYAVGIVYDDSFVIGGGTGGTTNTYAWGVNGSGQLGNAAVTAVSSAQPVGGTDYRKFRSISAGNAFTCFVDSNSDGYACGINTNGGLGDGSVTPRSTPTLILRSLKWDHISASKDTNAFAVGLVPAGTKQMYATNYATGTVYLRDYPAGTVYGWGFNTNGQVGDATTTPKSSPVAISGTTSYCKVVAGGSFAAALTVDGNIKCWGSNVNGQLGDGSVTGRSSPVTVLGGPSGSFKFIDVAAGSSFGMGLGKDLNIYCWGLNANGQLGVNDVTPRSSAVAVAGSRTYIAISAGSAAGFGLGTDGILYPWGVNRYGQLGSNSTTARSSPVAVSGSHEYGVYFRKLLNEFKIAVIPNTAYSVTVNSISVRFGSTPVGSGSTVRELELEYDA